MQIILFLGKDFLVMFIIYKLTNPTLTFIKPFLLLGLKLHYYETHNIQIERIHKIKTFSL